MNPMCAVTIACEEVLLRYNNVVILVLSGGLIGCGLKTSTRYSSYIMGATCGAGTAYHFRSNCVRPSFILVLVGFVFLMLLNYMSSHFKFRKRVVMSATISA